MLRDTGTHTEDDAGRVAHNDAVDYDDPPTYDEIPTVWPPADVHPDLSDTALDAIDRAHIRHELWLCVQMLDEGRATRAVVDELRTILKERDDRGRHQ